MRHGQDPCERLQPFESGIAAPDSMNMGKNSSYPEGDDNARRDLRHHPLP
jgi:hypothetical protein